MDEKRKRGRQGMGFMCFFNDYSVYHGVKLLSSQMGFVRMDKLVLKIVSDYYLELMKQNLDTIDPQIFHRQIEEASKKKGTNSIADFIEYCCSKWLEKEVEHLKPVKKRG